MYSDYY
jgi:uncharacterized protein YqcC (DUF446 family)